MNNPQWDKTNTTPQAFPQSDYTSYSTLSPVGKRKMLRRIAQQRTLKQMTYEQAKLYHRLKGRT
jgi:hypothetical protein